ncbi:unnamed protein product [Penicillium olsonii]|uniref:Uncharacterized protein n=1 Tax=Penicillium olsonii TaxID=99116 RepID=A0A9W4HIY4_PENOL|nr:unnamed protein product [Penicillium olsonii]CAG8118343.1 unnamed protein product [Penicillium olsonii]
MSLGTSADNAEIVAAGFHTFRAPLPEHAAEVTSLIADLYSISSSLTNLEALNKDPRYRRNFLLIQSDLSLVQTSLKYTVDDTLDFFRALDGGQTSSAVYKRTWTALNDFFWDEAQYSLATRLAKYKTFMRELAEVVKDDGQDPQYLAGLRNGMKLLCDVQASHITERLRRVPLYRNASSGSAEPMSPASDPRAPRPRSHERRRPAYTSPTSPMSASSGTYSDFPPSVPSVPASPMTSATSATSATSRSTNTGRPHWAQVVFKTFSTNTPLPRVGERSNCYGDICPDAREMLIGRGFEELLEFRPEGESHLRVYFYIRKRDSHVRILIKVPHRSRSSDYYTLPLSLVDVQRDGSCLCLYRQRRGKNENVLWALLTFKTMEALVTFHHTLLALRSQDLASDAKGDNLSDCELIDEVELYGGKINDDGYLHGLRIWEDQKTGAVRLQASVHGGEMGRTPVWTAFFNHNLEKNWIKSEDSKTLVLRHLKPIIFMSEEDYVSPRNSYGRIIEFKSSSGE